jgi:hypothetical protein
MKYKNTILFLFLFSSLTMAQVSYEGPDTGSVSSGVMVSTDNFTRVLSLAPPVERGIRNTIAPKYDKSIKSLVPPAAPKDANYFEDPSINKNNKLHKKSGVDGQPVLLQDFEGIPMTNSIPPDPTIAVGPNHILACVNSRFAIWDKNGNLLKNIDADDWYEGVLTAPGAFDPQIIYDHYAERWFMLWDSQRESPPRAHFLISISDDDDPTGTWYNYALPSNKMGKTTVNHWGDYPQIGFDEEAIYINSRQFTFGDSEKEYDLIRILNKVEYYSAAGGPVMWTDLYDISYPGWPNIKPDVIHPVLMYSNSSEYYFVHALRGGADFITLYRLTNPLTNPALTGVNIPVTSYDDSPDANQLGGGTPLIASNGSHIKTAPVYRDGYIWYVHSVGNPASASSTSLRYGKINVNTSSVVEEATFGAANHWYIFPSLAVDKDQNIAINYTRTSLTEYAGVFYTSRLATDPPGLNGSVLLKEGTGNYIVTFGGDRNRWGDYHGIYLDPVTEYNIWMFTEFAPETNTWGTWAGEIRLVPFSGIYLHTNKTEFDFGDVEVDIDSDPITAVISNYGLDDLTINSLAESDGPFRVITELTFPTTLQTYDSLIIEIVFNPPDTGDYDNFLEVSTNYPGFNGFDLNGYGYTVAPAAFNQIYGSSGIQNNGEILRIDISSGAGELIGPSLFPEIKSISVHPKTNVVYGVVSNFEESQIVRINANGGDSYNLFTVPVRDMYGISFDTSGTLYGVTKEGELYELDLFFKTATFVTDAEVPVSNIAFNPLTNELWASAYITFGPNKDRIFKINLNNGDTTLVGITGMGTINYALVFDGFGKLFAVTGAPSQINDFIHIDTLTGAGTVIGQVGYKNITGLAYIWDGLTSVEPDNASLIPSEFKLSQNYPNPFNPSTTIEFSLPVASDVKLYVYNILGELVDELINKSLTAGKHSVNWNVRNEMVSGVYFFELKASNVAGQGFADLKKMILMK